MNDRYNRGSGSVHGTGNYPISRQEAARQAAIRAERRRIEAIKRKKARKAMFEKFVAYSAFSLIGFAICLAALFIYIQVDFASTDSVPDEPVKITLSDDETVVLDKSRYSYKNGEYYVSLTEVCRVLSLTLHGNVKSMTLTTRDGLDATFSIGTPNVSISGKSVILTGRTYFENENLFIPVSFFTKHCKGVNAEFDKMGKQKGYNLIFSDNLSFNSERQTESHAASLSAFRHDDSMFISDLSEYEKYMNPSKRDEYLLLVSEDSPLSSEYVPVDLIDVSDTRSDREKQKMRTYAAKALEAMFIEMRANGFDDVTVTSGYRSYSYQASQYEKEFDKLFAVYGDKAENHVKKTVASAGASEHQSGLCADMHNLPSNSAAFASEGAYKWLYSNCANFGFILRYPKDKTEITGRSFEPWHFRYVGRYHAQKIMDGGLCLEEYIASAN